MPRPLRSGSAICHYQNSYSRPISLSDPSLIMIFHSLFRMVKANNLISERDGSKY